MISQDNSIKLLDSKPLFHFFVQTAFGTAFTYLTSGIYLSGLALLMGAGDVLVSYLSLILNICGVLILALSAFLERFQSRKQLTILLTVLSRLMTLFIAAIPALAPERLRLALFLPTVILAFTLQAQTTVVLNQWMLDFVDEKKSGRYISLRQTMTLAVTVVLSVAGGSWMDFMEGGYTGFVLLFAFAGVMGAVEVALLARTPDGALYHAAERKRGLWAALALPLRNKRFTDFVLYILLFYLLLTFADGFTMVYLMKYLALPYRTVTLMYLLLSLPQVVLLGVWGRISDRRGHDFVLRNSILLFTGEMLFLALAGPENWWIFVPAAFLTASVANSGFAVAVFNRRYELMPQENRIVYDNFYTALIGLGSILGPMLGGLVKGGLEANPVATTVPFAGIRALYLISSVGILLQYAVMAAYRHSAGAKL